MSETRTYTIHRSSGPVGLNPKDNAWSKAEKLSIDVYPWYKGGDKQGTEGRLLYDDEAVYALFICQDKHIYSEETRPNGNVYKDSCVEFFAIPDLANGGYFNFEANCCGCVHLGWGPGRPDRKLAGPETHAGLKVATSVSGPTKNESPSDNGWWLAARLPFSTISQFAGLTVAPRAGTIWKANFYRCGGKTDDQYACWNPIGHPKPDFHRPEFFGTLRFS